MSSERTPPLVRVPRRVGAVRVTEANVREREAEAERARRAAEEAREAEILSKALETVRAEWAERFESVIEELAAECARVRDLADDVLVEIEPHVIELSLGIARRLVAKEIDEGRLEIRPLVEAILCELREPGEPPVIEVALHADDHARLESAGGAPEIRGIRIVADPDVPPGACVVTTQEGRVWSDLDSRVRAIRQALRPEVEVPE